MAIAECGLNGNINIILMHVVIIKTHTFIVQSNFLQWWVFYTYIYSSICAHAYNITLNLADASIHSNLYQSHWGIHAYGSNLRKVSCTMTLTCTYLHSKYWLQGLGIEPLELLFVDIHLPSEPQSHKHYNVQPSYHTSTEFGIYSKI